MCQQTCRVIRTGVKYWMSSNCGQIRLITWSSFLLSIKKCCLHDSIFSFSSPVLFRKSCCTLPLALTLGLRWPPQMLSFAVFRTSLFPNPMVDLVHIDTGSKILHSTIVNPIHDLKVKDTDLRAFMVEFYVKVFRTSLFPNPWYIYFMFGMMIDAGPKFYVV